MYGSVACLTIESTDSVPASFVMAWSRVAPKRQLPRLELGAALAGAQLSALIPNELTINITKTFFFGLTLPQSLLS